MATIPLTGLEKNSTQSKVRGYITVKEFADLSLDPVIYLRSYLNRTCEARVAYLMHCEFPPKGLFLALSPPHQPVQPCTLAKWLLFVMHLPGIDTTAYKAQSARSASAAHMKTTKGLSITQILDRGFWSKRDGTSKVFKTFYDKPIE